MLKQIEKFIKEIGLSFDKIDLSNEYCKNEAIADSILQNKIRSFLETNYSVDYILDRINEVGIKNLNVFENFYLEKYGGNQSV
jgi:tRNA A37 threonylcarbamoyladenosine dehydratase